ncbi:MAG: hypothetical protein WC845_02750 [Candidatus Staskawiczbacteria bacterium]|jgi:hypothetical protein
MKFTTKADYWYGNRHAVVIITIEGKGGKVFITTEYEKKIEAEMIYNKIQLRFEAPGAHGTRIYIVFNDTHHPPVPIAQMYKELHGES